MRVTTRSYNAARTCSNNEESVLMPHVLGNNFMVKHLSLHVDDDPRIEAQPLYMPGGRMNDGKLHDVIYVGCWTRPDGARDKAVYQLHEVDITDGKSLRSTEIQASADQQTTPGRPAAKFVPSRQKQRPALLLPATSGAPSKKTLFVSFGMTHEEGDTTHGWLIADDVGTLQA